MLLTALGVERVSTFMGSFCFGTDASLALILIFLAMEQGLDHASMFRGKVKAPAP